MWEAWPATRRWLRISVHRIHALWAFTVFGRTGGRGKRRRDSDGSRHLALPQRLHCVSRRRTRESSRSPRVYTGGDAGGGACPPGLPGTESRRSHSSGPGEAPGHHPLTGDRTLSVPLGRGVGQPLDLSCFLQGQAPSGGAASSLFSLSLPPFLPSYSAPHVVVGAVDAAVSWQTGAHRSRGGGGPAGPGLV